MIADLKRKQALVRTVEAQLRARDRALTGGKAERRVRSSVFRRGRVSERARTLCIACAARPHRAAGRPARCPGPPAERRSVTLTSRSTPTATVVAKTRPAVARVAPAPARTGTRTLVVDAVAYHLTGHTASGLPVAVGVVAVDPRVIPLGTRLFVPGYGRAVAADVGSAVKGNIIDLWMPRGRRPWPGAGAPSRSPSTVDDDETADDMRPRRCRSQPAGRCVGGCDVGGSAWALHEPFPRALGPLPRARQDSSDRDRPRDRHRALRAQRHEAGDTSLEREASGRLGGSRQARAGLPLPHGALRRRPAGGLDLGRRPRAEGLRRSDARDLRSRGARPPAASARHHGRDRHASGATSRSTTMPVGSRAGSAASSGSSHPHSRRSSSTAPQAGRRCRHPCWRQRH